MGAIESHLVSLTRRVVVVCEPGRSRPTLDLLQSVGCSVVSVIHARDARFHIPAGVCCDFVLFRVAMWSRSELHTACADVGAVLNVPIVVLYERFDPDACHQARLAGVVGVLTAPVSSAQLKSTIEFAVGAPVTMVERVGVDPLDLAPEPAISTLSAREHEVFDLLMQGRRTGAIAKTLFISAHTVRKHIKAVFRKLGVHSQVELIARYRVDAGDR